MLPCGDYFWVEDTKRLESSMATSNSSGVFDLCCDPSGERVEDSGVSNDWEIPLILNGADMLLVYWVIDMCWLWLFNEWEIDG